MTEIATHQTIPPRDMFRVILESPYSSEDDAVIERNSTYARACVKDSLLRGEAPLASHLLYTQPGILNDRDRNERAHGINAGHAWIRSADAVVVYIDLGISEGMLAGVAIADFCKIPVEYRKLKTGEEAS